MNNQEHQSLLLQVTSEIANKGEIDQSAFAVLTTVYPTIITATLEILDAGKITRFETQESKRQFYRVKEQRKQKSPQVSYFDVVEEFCFCPFFSRQCLDKSGSSLTCQHVLAVKLAEALSRRIPDSVHVKQIEEQDYGPLLLEGKAQILKFEEKQRFSGQSSNMSVGF